MSRIGRSPIPVPSGVDVTIAPGTVTVKGPQGTLSRTVPDPITLRQEEGTLYVERPNDERQSRAEGKHKAESSLWADHGTSS